MADRCPTCKQMIQPMKQPRIRRCRKCGLTLDRYDKFTFVNDGDATYLEHRHCDNPQGYMSKADWQVFNRKHHMQ